MTTYQFLKQVTAFFKANNLDHEKPRQTISRKNKEEVVKLKQLAAIYMKFHPEHGRQSCACQNRINDFVILLQLYIKKNKKPEKVVEIKEEKE